MRWSWADLAAVPVDVYGVLIEELMRERQQQELDEP